jgi:hypothetical protein
MTGTANFAAIRGYNTDTSEQAIAVLGLVDGPGHAIEGQASNPGGFAGYFMGNVHATGTISAPTKLFRIDHPLDPANKFLNHASVESSEMKTMYDGVVTLDSDGRATVTLPSWFNAVNGNFRYQLTPIGGSMPGLYISEEVAGDNFRISGGTPNGKVCWLITGIRQDPYAKANPLQVEQDKRPEDRGFYLNPQVYGQPWEKTLGMTLEKET